MTITAVGTAGAGGTGVTFTPALAFAHASGASVQDSGTGITFTPALTRNHWVAVNVANAAANQAGHTGDIGGVPLVQPPPPGSAPGTVCGRVVVPLAVQRRQLVDVERLRRPLLGGDADHAEHDGGAQRAADPDVAAADVRDRRRREHLRRVADAELPHRQRRVHAERHRDVA